MRILIFCISLFLFGWGILDSYFGLPIELTRILTGWAIMLLSTTRRKEETEK